jgi:hypothetical protein
MKRQFLNGMIQAPSLSLSENAMATVLHVYKPPPVILLESTSYLLRSCCHFFYPLSVLLIKLLYFHFILNYQRRSDFPTHHSLCTLLYQIIIVLLWADSSDYAFNFLSFTNGLKSL